MSEEEKTTTVANETTVDSRPFLLKLKEEKPAVFFGGIAGVVAVLGLIMLSGDDNSSGAHKSKVVITMGGSYTLEAPNALTETSLKILKVPGQMASFDNADDVVCHAPTGTAVEVKNFQDAFGTKKLFTQVEIKQASGDCRAGVKGWTITNNLK